THLLLRCLRQTDVATARVVCRGPLRGDNNPRHKVRAVVTHLLLRCLGQPDVATARVVCRGPLRGDNNPRHKVRAVATHLTAAMFARASRPGPRGEHAWRVGEETLRRADVTRHAALVELVDHELERARRALHVEVDRLVYGLVLALRGLVV